MTGTVEVPVITVDGPSGSGKGTIGHRLAKCLGWHLLDSGALYRLVALCALRRSLDLADEEQVRRTAETMNVDFLPGDDCEPVRVLLDGRPVGTELRGEDCGRGASLVAAMPGVRAALLERQRRHRARPGLVADGRDMGTVVFPDACAKLFLTASAEERADRRYKQLMGKGIAASLSDLLSAIRERDRRDTTRSVAPLRPAEDAVVIDTTGVDIDTVMQKVVEVLYARGLIS